MLVGASRAVRPALAALLCAVLFAGLARAQTPDEPAAGRERFIDRHPWLITLSLVGAAAAVSVLTDAPDDPRIQGGLLFDASARGALRGDSRSDRSRADDISTWLQIGLIAAPHIDSLAARWRWRDSDRFDPNQRFWRLLHSNVNSQAISFGLSEGLKHGVGRRRPVEDICAENKQLPGCDPRRSTNDSFVSGHSSAAFSSAGLLCANRRLLEHSDEATLRWSWEDSLVCGGALLTASAVGALRMVADEHYATDVIAGAALGTVLGLALPHWWIGPESDRGRAPLAGLSPWLDRDDDARVAGIRWQGRF